MRIIAGEFRGRRLIPPATDATRPITDRVKQSLFDVLAPRIAGARVYDCFSGTGSMGLECLSRGAASATFFEADRSALKRLKQNIDALGVANRSKIVPGDLFKWFAANPPVATHTAVADPPEPPADLIFLDPPYRFLTDRPDPLRAWAAQTAARHLAPGGRVLFRHDSKDRLDLPPLTPADVREYGGMTLEFLQATSGHAAPIARPGPTPARI